MTKGIIPINVALILWERNSLLAVIELASALISNIGQYTLDF